MYGRNALGRLKSTWLSVELNLLLHALILVKSGCFTDRETLQYSKQYIILTWWKRNDISNVILSKKLVSFFMPLCLFRHNVVCLSLQKEKQNLDTCSVSAGSQDHFNCCQLSEDRRFPFLPTGAQISTSRFLSCCEWSSLNQFCLKSFRL